MLLVFVGMTIVSTVVEMAGVFCWAIVCGRRCRQSHPFVELANLLGRGVGHEQAGKDLTIRWVVFVPSRFHHGDLRFVLSRSARLRLAQPRAYVPCKMRRATFSGCRTV